MKPRERLRRAAYWVAMRVLQGAYRVAGKRIARVDHPAPVRALLRRPCLNEAGEPGLVTNFAYGAAGWRFLGISLLTGRPWAAATPIPMGRVNLDQVHLASCLVAGASQPTEWHTRVTHAAAAYVADLRRIQGSLSFSNPFLRELIKATEEKR